MAPARLRTARPPAVPTRASLPPSLASVGPARHAAGMRRAIFQAAPSKR